MQYHLLNVDGVYIAQTYFYAEAFANKVKALYFDSIMGKIRTYAL